MSKTPDPPHKHTIKRIPRPHRGHDPAQDLGSLTTHVFSDRLYAVRYGPRQHIYLLSTSPWTHILAIREEDTIIAYEIRHIVMHTQGNYAVQTAAKADDVIIQCSPATSTNQRQEDAIKILAHAQNKGQPQ